MTAEIIVALIKVLIKDGVPALMSLLDRWKVIDPTVDDFQALKSLMKRPEDF